MRVSLSKFFHNPDQTRLRNGVGGRFGGVITTLMAVVAFLSSWATYTQFSLGLTYVTLPVLISLAFVVLYYIGRVRLPRLAVADWCVVVVYLIALASFFWSLQPQAWALQIFWYSICFAVYFLVRFFINTPARIRFVGLGVIFGVVACSLLLSVPEQQFYGFERQSIDGLNGNFTAYVLVGSLYICLIIEFFRFFPSYIRIFIWALVILILYDVMVLGTRGAAVECVGVLLWQFTHKLSSARFTRLLTVVGLGFVFLFTFGFVDQLLNYFDGMSVRSTGDLSGRVPTWEFAREVIYNNIFLGIGIGSFSHINPAEIGAHNFFLTIILETGFVGFLLYVGFFFALFYPALRKNSSLGAKFIMGAFACFWLPIASSGHWELAPFSWLLLGLTYNMLRLRTENYE